MILACKSKSLLETAFAFWCVDCIPNIFGCFNEPVGITAGWSKSKDKVFGSQAMPMLPSTNVVLHSIQKTPAKIRTFAPLHQKIKSTYNSA